MGPKLQAMGNAKMALLPSPKPRLDTILGCIDMPLVMANPSPTDRFILSPFSLFMVMLVLIQPQLAGCLRVPVVTGRVVTEVVARFKVTVVTE